MKKTLQITTAFVFSLFVLFGCSKDLEVSPDARFSNVPSGEIVAVEKRNEILTGFSELSNGRVTASQKWWKQIRSVADYKGCGDRAEDMDLSQEEVYYAFKENGELYYKQGENGSEHFHTTWEWASSDKSGIILGIAPDVVFTIRALNSNEVVYASSQTLGGGCSGITWEKYGEPLFENSESHQEGREESPSLILGNDLKHSPFRSITYGDGYSNGPYTNAPRFPSNKVLMREFVEVPSGLDPHYILTIGGGENEPMLEIKFPLDIAQGKLYEAKDLPITYHNARPFDNDFKLSKMQEVKPGIDHKGYIKVVGWDKESRNLYLDFEDVHLVTFKLCSDDCDLFSPTYDGGYQYETDYVSIHGGISMIFEYRRVL